LGGLLVSLGGLSVITNLNVKSADFAKNEVNSSIPGVNPDFSVNTFIALTVHNIIQDLTCLIGGLFFFIPSLLISALNAYNFFSIFLSWPFEVILYGILPHGIFEIPSSIFALAGAIMLFKTELKVIKGIVSRKTTIKEQINESQYLIKDAIITIFIVIILLVIAGFIETFITSRLIEAYAMPQIMEMV